MTPEAFRQAVAAALAELPREFRDKIADTAIVIEARPTSAERRVARVRRDQDLYGLYQGIPLPARSEFDLPELPDRIVFFQEPLERAFPEPAQLAHEIRKTVLHEVGHHFGLTERRLRELGYG